MPGIASFRQKLRHEIKAMGLAALYFGAWLAMLLFLKKLILAEYHIAFQGLSLAVVGTLVLSKVVIVMEHVPLGAWIRTQPAWVDVLVRTVLYATGVLVVLLLEKAFEGRREHGGFVASLASIFQHPDMPHLWVNTLCLSGALLGYNVLTVLRRYLGEGALLRLLLQPFPENSGAKLSQACAPIQKAEQNHK